MVLKLIDQKIRAAFSDAALQYDVLAGLHKEIGRELIRKIKTSAERPLILDVGMGTGWLTGKLSFYFPDACVVGLDFAHGMVAAAKNREEDFRILQADACRLPVKPASCDVIVSNLVYQWVADLTQGFRSCHTALKDGGRLYLTLFGYRTFEELFAALEKTQERARLPIHRLAGGEKIAEALAQAGFRDVEIRTELIKVHFPDMMALVRWIKGIGANVLPKDIFIGKNWLQKAAAHYDQTHNDRFGVYAHFEVIWVEVRK